MHPLTEPEKWKRIPGFARAEASSLGRIRSYARGVARFHKVHGCRSVTVEGRPFTPQRLICLAFHGEPTPDKNFAALIDGDKTNLAASNLMWWFSASPESPEEDAKLAEYSRPNPVRATLLLHFAGKDITSVSVAYKIPLWRLKAICRHADRVLRGEAPRSSVWTLEYVVALTRPLR